LKKCILLFGVAILTVSVAAATDNPQAEAFLGYSLVRFFPNTPNLTGITGTNGFGDFNLNGGNAQLAYNFRPGIGLVLDVGAVHAGSLFGIANNVTPNQSGVDHTLTNFVLGPRYTFSRHKRLMPYVQGLFGGAHASSSTSVTLQQGGIIWPPPGLIIPPGTVQPVDATLRAERTGFAMLIGGGLDIKVAKHIALRPVEADYYFTRLPGFVTGNDTNKNHFRYSAGVNFLFGGAK
jgi:opacity protein-like surface antigen